MSLSNGRRCCSTGSTPRVSGWPRSRVRRRSRCCRSWSTSPSRSRPSCNAPTRPRGSMPRAPEELRELVEGYLAELEPTPALGSLREPIRYALGGKRVRPVLCLAAGEAAGGDVDLVLPAAAAVELVHSFS